MAPAIIGSLFGRAVPAEVVDPTSLGPLAACAVLTAHNLVRRQDDNRPDPSRGVVDPHNINNTVMFVLFGFIGASFVILGIWFFFWAKNGGFYFKENDWDDYKSTVLRRRGPNGTILSNATPSTDLGGGSIYKDVDDRTTVSASTRYRDGDDGRTDITDSTYMTGITAGVSNIGAREARRKKKEARDRERERRREEKAQAKEEKKAAKRGEGNNSRKVGADGALIDEEAEEQAKEHLRNYRHERPARVGGINAESDASTWDGSTNPSASSAGTRSERTEASELLGDRQRTPTSTPNKKSGGIRKVYSTADKVADREQERIRAEARRLQEKGRSHMSSAGSSSSSAPRRDFSFARGQTDDRERFAMRRIEENESSVVSGSTAYDDDRERERDRRRSHRHHVPGSYVGSEDAGSEVGTKSYHHPIPELTSSSVSGSGIEANDFAYQDDKRRQRRGGGYRRA